jgi:hypothetical protein
MSTRIHHSWDMGKKEGPFPLRQDLPAQCDRPGGHHGRAVTWTDNASDVGAGHGMMVGEHG